MLGLLGGGGWLIYTKVLRSPEKRLCTKVVELCGKGQLGKKVVERCESGVKQLQQSGGKDAISKAADCVDDAKSCVAATGCIVGASVKAAAGAIGDFLGGVKKALEDKK